MEELSPEEQYFLQTVLPHLIPPNSPTAPRGQSPVSHMPQQASPSALGRSSSPIGLAQPSGMNTTPDWGPPITDDYQHPRPRRTPPHSPQIWQHTSGQVPGNVSIGSDADRSILSISDYHPSLSTEDSRRELGDEKEDSLLKKFDRSVRAELGRRRQAYSTSMSVDHNASETRKEFHPQSLLEVQVDNLAKAEALSLYGEAMEAAEQAAAQVNTPEKAEREATRAYEARLIDVVASEGVTGNTPIEVVAYVGVTHPKNPRPPRH